MDSDEYYSYECEEDREEALEIFTLMQSGGPNSPDPELPMSLHIPLVPQLLALHPNEFKNATQNPFLQQVGLGTLPKETLQKWLSEHRIYVQHYFRFLTRFLGGLTELQLYRAPDPHVESLTDLMLDALIGVKSELKFLEKVAGEYDLLIDPNPSRNVDNASHHGIFMNGDTRNGIDLYEELFDYIGK